MTVPTPAAAQPVKLLALGDSLTAGYGLPEPQGFTRQLEKALAAKGYGVTVINAGVSGDTTAGGRARLDWALADRPDAAIVELGANDMLRGLDPGQARANLDAILKSLTERKIPTLLAGMYASPSLGKPYTDSFNAIYPDLAKSHNLPLYPFFLDGVALRQALFQPDGLHPNAQGVAVIVERILPSVTALLDSLPRMRKTGEKTGG
ncbi:arylesterase [Azospirillum sp. B510]|uniref:arylesterase n=1 Tax=Azospirillum sp. (strain B510) TaxID=137722 RepID=UPI000310AD23|nr:arylesterase [Azospirillum sp. B510]